MAKAFPFWQFTPPWSEEVDISAGFLELNQYQKTSFGWDGEGLTN